MAQVLVKRCDACGEKVEKRDSIIVMLGRTKRQYTFCPRRGCGLQLFNFLKRKKLISTIKPINSAEKTRKYQIRKR